MYVLATVHGDEACSVIRYYRTYQLARRALVRRANSWGNDGSNYAVYPVRKDS